MAKVTLTELKSWRDWLPLQKVRVKPEQRKFQSTLIVSYLQSAHPAVTPYSLHLDDNLIGYVMLIHAENPAQWIIERLTISADYQRQGYGYDVADQLVDMVYEFENSEMMVARYATDNEAARQLFAKLGFEEQDTLVRKRNIALLEFEFEETEDDDEDDLVGDEDIEDNDESVDDGDTDDDATSNTDSEDLER